jgi:hypothetical protein
MKKKPFPGYRERLSNASDNSFPYVNSFTSMTATARRKKYIIPNCFQIKKAIPPEEGMASKMIDILLFMPYPPCV